MKLAIWVITVLGILPILFLSATQIHVQLRARKYFSPKGATISKPDFAWVTFKPVFKSNPFKYQDMRLTHKLWPAIIALIGVICVLLGLFFLIPKQASVTQTYGIKKLHSYVERLVRSKAPFTSLGIFTLDNRRGFSVWKRNNVVEIHLMSQIIPDDGREPKIRQFFKTIGVEPSEDYTFRNGEIEDSARALGYPIEANIDLVTKTCDRILREIYNVKDRDGLKFDLDYP